MEVPPPHDLGDGAAAVASEAEPEEEADEDDEDEAGFGDSGVSDSSSLKSGSPSALRDRKRSRSLAAYANVLSDEDLSNAAVAPAGTYWQEGVPPESIDVKLAALKQYFRATRALYELQFQMKRPAAILRMKPNSYGFKTNSTFDTLAALISPLRQRQVLDDWTALEIAIFEEAFEKFGRRFHLIADQLPSKTTKDVIALFYVWKRHGSCTTYHDYDDDIRYLELPIETKFRVDQLRRRQACTKAYLNAARCLYAPRSAPSSNHKRAKISEFGLQGVPGLKAAVHGTSLLRSASVLDAWTPIELRIFEVAIECYGKDFYHVAQVIGTKTCREVVALYYVWKKDAHYQTVKNRWGKTEGSAKKDFVAPHAPAAAAADTSP
ncbi:hypothetical protein PybrP1_007659 [[Pythium] brassicae (nom. inval.)]|nr:hypothetical protein PybrP1_007659 [[Pythium] brassicae (nom. inval.)]